jgi:tripartite-type tricarboxylate transporter receptor subunit TctC
MARTLNDFVSRLRIGLAVASSIAALAAVTPFEAACAQNFPSRPITMIVPFAAGGAADSTARIVAESMGRYLNATIIIENIGGAGGAIGTARVKNAEANGYTIGLGHMGTHAAAVPIHPKLPYDPRKDFQYIGLISNSPNVIYVRKDFPARTLQEFIKIAKEKGSALNMGHGGIGAASHVACVMFFELIDTKPTLVAYRGFGQTLNDLLSGQLDGGCDLLASVAPQARAGNLRVLAVAAAQRSEVLPDAPTSAEAGLPDFRTETWTGLYAPKATPEPVMQRLRDAVSAAMNDPVVKERLANIGASIPAPETRGTEYMSNLVNDEVKRWTEILTKANLKLEQ